MCNIYIIIYIYVYITVKLNVDMYRHVWNSCSATIRRSFLWFALVRSSQRSWDPDRSTIWLVSRLSCVNFGSSRTPMIQTLAEGQTLGGWVNLGSTYPNWSGRAIWSAEFSTESLAFTQYMKRCHAMPTRSPRLRVQRCHIVQIGEWSWRIDPWRW